MGIAPLTACAPAKALLKEAPGTMAANRVRKSEKPSGADCFSSSLLSEYSYRSVLGSTTLTHTSPPLGTAKSPRLIVRAEPSGHVVNPTNTPVFEADE